MNATALKRWAEGYAENDGLAKDQAEFVIQMTDGILAASPKDQNATPTPH